MTTVAERSRRVTAHGWKLLCWFLFVVSVPTASVEAETATPPVATADEDAVPPPSSAVCEVKPADICRPSASKRRLYENGGTAQAYKPNVPVSDTVCSESASLEHRYKFASWPFLRRSFPKGTAPRLNVRLNLHSCQRHGGDDVSDGISSCCCSPMMSAGSESVVDVWQTKPDGKYPSLSGRSAKTKNLSADSGTEECRARIPIHTSGDDATASVRFSTVAPGSTGVMSGLGPGSMDSSPYGPPVIHMLFAIDGYVPMLTDVPVLLDRSTLQPKNFSMSVFDWRGVSWVKPKSESPTVEVVGWKADASSNTIELEANVYLSVDASDNGQGSRTTTLESELCPSWIYGFPSSFFLEPIAVCFPTMMDFFDL